jgi:hypothetical protein
VSVLGATQSVDVTAVSCATTAPVATITSPAATTTLYTDTFDEAQQRFYVEVTLQATATDAEDGSVASGGFTWTTKRTDIQPALLGTGNSVTVRLYAAQGSNVYASHTITLIVTDSSGTRAHR